MTRITFCSDLHDNYNYHLSFGYDQAEQTFDLNYSNRFDFAATDNVWLIYPSTRLSKKEKTQLKVNYLEQFSKEEISFFADVDVMLYQFVEQVYGVTDYETNWEIKEIIDQIKLFVKVYEHPILDGPADFAAVYEQLGEEVFLDIMNYNGGVEGLKHILGIRYAEEAGAMQLITFESIDLSLFKEHDKLRVLPRVCKSLAEFLFQLYGMNKFYDLATEEKIELIY